MNKNFAGIIGGLTLLIGAKAAHAQTGSAVTRTLTEEISRTGIWMLVAVVLFLIAYKIADIMTPGDLKTQLAEGNTALAIFAGSIIIGFALIIAQLIS